MRRLVVTTMLGSVLLGAAGLALADEMASTPAATSAGPAKPAKAKPHRTPTTKKAKKTAQSTSSSTVR